MSPAGLKKCGRTGSGTDAETGARKGGRTGPETAAETALTPGEPPAVYFPPLTRGILLRRYKRFLADVELADGSLVTAHTNNTGAMLDCSEPGRPVLLSRHDGLGRTYPWSWELIEMPDGLVGVNTVLPNRLAALAASLGALTGGRPPLGVRREVRVGDSRLDLALDQASGPEILVEVKSSTLVRNGVALFPDAPSVRGAKHLATLARIAEYGGPAVILVLVQRSGAEAFSPADGIDPGWGAALRGALARGVELLVREVGLSPARAVWGRELPARL